MELYENITEIETIYETSGHYESVAEYTKIPVCRPVGETDVHKQGESSSNKETMVSTRKKSLCTVLWVSVTITVTVLVVIWWIIKLNSISTDTEVPCQFQGTKTKAPFNINEFEQHIFLNGGKTSKTRLTRVFQVIRKVNLFELIYNYTDNQVVGTFSVVNGTFWIPFSCNKNSGGIKILSILGEEIKQLSFPNMKITSVFETITSDLLAASEQGIYVLNPEGQIQYQVCAGNFQHMAVSYRYAAAISQGSTIQVTVLQLVNNNTQWKVNTVFTPKLNIEQKFTVMIKHGVIYLFNGIVYGYSLRGKYQSRNKINLPTSNMCIMDKHYGTAVFCDYQEHGLILRSLQSKSYDHFNFNFKAYDAVVDTVGNIFVLTNKGLLKIYHI